MIKRLLVLLLAIAAISVVAIPAFAGNDKQVDICHATNSQTNPYVSEHPAVKNNGDLTGGHLNHSGGVWYPGIADHSWGDIIPPYDYGDGQHYPGMNWPAGQAIFENGCEIPPPPPPPDVCPNIPGIQETVPEGMHVDEQGNCVRIPPPPPPDVCPNIPGIQETVPEGKYIDEEGNCVRRPPPPHDVCKNIEGIQETVPEGLIRDRHGNCVPPPTDVCPNIEGDQAEVPEGLYIDEEGDCVRIPPPPPPTDVCLNLRGIQEAVPAGMIRDADGNCAPPPPPSVPLDGCEVFNASFAVNQDLPFGIFGWSAAGFVKYDQYSPDKRGLIFEDGVLADGMVVFVTDASGVDHLFDVVKEVGFPTRCVERAEPAPVPAPAAETCVVTDFYAFRGVDAVYFSALCDPHVQIVVDGTIMLDDAYFGNERARVPADPSAFIEIFINGVPWGHYDANSDVLQPG